MRTGVFNGGGAIMGVADEGGRVCVCGYYSSMTKALNKTKTLKRQDELPELMNL